MTSRESADDDLQSANAPPADGGRQKSESRGCSDENERFCKRRIGARTDRWPRSGAVR